jgi:hypothetical protein
MHGLFLLNWKKRVYKSFILIPWSCSEGAFTSKLVWPVPLAQVLPRPQLIFPSQNLVFWSLFEFFSGGKHFKINISHILKSKYYQINSIKSCYNIFQTTPKAEIFSYNLI